MGKITCLTSMFARKGKLKVITPAICIKRDSIWESSQKILLSKDSENLSSEGSIAKDEKSDVMADLEKKPVDIEMNLSAVSSITEWAKDENNASWTEQNDAARPVSYGEVFEFDTSGLNAMKKLEEGVVTVTEGDGAGAEVAYGGDEDEEFEKREGFCVIQMERQSEGSASGELSPEEQRSGSSAENETATYYGFHSNMARGSASQFDEGAIGDYVSDPGVYHDDNSCVEQDVEDEDQFRSQSRDADHNTLKKARSEGGLYDLGLISHQDKDLVPVSQGSPGMLYPSVSRRDFSIRVPKSVLESSHSEADLRDLKDLYLNVSFPDKASGELKQKPWWKMFLFAHRNIHRERSSLSRSEKHLLSAGAAGYSSDIDYYRGSPKMDIDAASYPKSDIHPESVLNGSCVKIGEEGVEYDDVPQATDGTTRDEFQAPYLVYDNSGKDAKLSHFERPDLRRVAEWISNIDPTPLSGDDLEAGIVDPSDSELPAPAASFFREGGLERRNHQAGDQAPDADTEMASFIARSVNPLSTVAHFSGVGLRLIPPLGVHNNLKTLNLSANAIVRITPGCLPRSLHYLDLSRNKIVVIEGFRDLSRLRVLSLSHNRILRIGHGLANCTSLRELHLAGNKISEVEGLHRLLKLSFIDLGFNKLSSGKSISQLAANYNSLQAINLLGNPLHSNLGEEALRKLITGIAPHVVYLNKQAMKAVSARDATVDSVARAALATSSHHAHQRGKTSSQSKPLRCRNGKSATTSVVSSPRHHRDKSRSGDKSAGNGGHGHSRSSALKNKAASELPPRHRHSQQSRHTIHVSTTALVKESSSRPVLVPPPLSH